MILRHPFHDLPGLIGRPIVHRNHFVIVIVEFQQPVQRLFDVAFFIARRYDDRNSRIAGSSDRIAIPFRLGDIGHTGHADRGINDAREPGQSQDGAGDPMKVMHPD